MAQDEPAHRRRNGHSLPFPFPGGGGEPARVEEDDFAIDRSEFGRMAIDARSRGFEISPTTLEPVGPAFEEYARLFDYRRPAAMFFPTKPAPRRQDPTAGSPRHSLARPAIVAAGFLLMVLLARACGG